jgi:hypothetical protein
MVLASFRLLDFSCSGFAFAACLLLLWCAWVVVRAARKASTVLRSDAAKKVGRNVLTAWIASWFRK